MYNETADLDWHRHEVESVRHMLRHLDLPDTGYARCLDVGGGEGLHLPWLYALADNIIVADILDYIEHNKGMFGKAVKDRAARHNLPYLPGKAQFHNIDARRLIYRDAAFDIVLSINAFEHIPEPEAAFREIIRVTKPGGVVVLQFDPLWHSPEGHHLPHLKPEPWQHVIEDEETFIQTIRAKGGTDGDVEVFQTHMNRVPYEAFIAMLTGPLAKEFRTYNLGQWANTPADEPRTSHPNYAAALAAGFSEANLTVRGLRFIGVRASANDPKPAPPAARPKPSLAHRVVRRARRMLKG